MPTVHFKIIISWDWINGIGYFSGYELVERLEVCMSDKERIRVVERLILSFVFLYAIPTRNRLLVDVARAVFLGHATHYVSLDNNNNMEKWVLSAMYQKPCLLFPMHLILLG